MNDAAPRSLLRLVAVLFFAALAVIVLSWMGTLLGWPVQSLLSSEGIRWTLRHAGDNFLRTPALPLFILSVGGGAVVSSGLWEALCHPRRLSRKRKRALLPASFTFGLYALLLFAALSPSGLLLGVTGTLARSPFADGAVPLASLGLALTGWMFGWASDRFRSGLDIVRGMASLPASLSVYFLYLFVASQCMGFLRYAGLLACIGLSGEIPEYLLYYLPLLLWLRLPGSRKRLRE